MTWKQATIGGVISGVAAAAIIGACGIAFGERWSEEAQYLRPTCASPKGLRQIPPATVTASDTSRRRDAKDTNLPVKVLDGYSGSVWTPTDTSITWADVPAPVEPSPEPSSVALAMPKNMLVWPRSSSPSPSPSASPSRTHASVASRFVPRVNADESTLILLLESRTDVRLVCVNNALGSGEFRYTNWGKVRTLHVWGDGSSEPEPRVLQALPWELSETQQEAGRNLGETLQVRLRIGDAYAGEGKRDRAREVLERARSTALGQSHQSLAEEIDERLADL